MVNRKYIKNITVITIAIILAAPQHVYSLRPTAERKSAYNIMLKKMLYHIKI
ncbi:MAG: hypothetical protein V2A72_00370 [Candidatus Omnitrophota bacterium]